MRSARSAARVQGGHRLGADQGGIRIVGDGVQRVQVVPGDDLGDLFAVAGEGRAQVGGHGQVAGLAIAAGDRVVGDLPQHLLGEPVAAPLRRQRVGGYAQHLAADQVGQRVPHRRLVLPGHRDQRLGRERGAQHGGVRDQPPGAGVQGIEPGGQQRVQAVRHGQLADGPGQPVHPFDRLDHVPVHQRADGLHREQRDALSLAGDLGSRRLRHARHRGHQVQRGPDGAHRVAFGRYRVPHTAMTASPMNFSTTPP